MVLTCSLDGYTINPLKQEDNKLKKIPVRFADKQVLQISDLAELTGTDNSQVARAAMHLGLEALKSGCNGRKLSTQELVVINNLKALN
jgi:hypothetical protein